METDSLKEADKLKEENLLLKKEIQQINEKLDIQNEFIKNAPFLAWAVNEKFEYIFISPSFKERYEKISGFKISLGQSLFDTIPPEYIPKWKERFAKAINGEEFIDEETVELADKKKHYKLYIYPIIRGNRISGVQVFISETTRMVEAENKEIDSLKKMQKILQHVEDIYYEVDLDGKVIDVSPAIESFSEYTREEILGSNIIDIYADPKDREIFLKEIKSKGQVKNYTFKAVDKNKKKKTVSINASLIHDSNGEPVKISGILRDITEIEQINKDLRWLRRAIEHSPVSIIITDTDGNIEYTNSFFTKLTGYTREETFGKNPSFLKSGLHEDEFYKKLWDTIKNGKIWEGEFRNRHKNGSLFWEHATISPVFDTNGEIINYIAIKEDYTKRKEDADEIKRLKTFNEQIINTMREGIIVESSDGTILYVNPAFTKMTGFTNKDVIGRNWKKVVAPKYHAIALEANERRKDNISDSYEVKLQTKDGKSVPVLIGGTPIIEDGKFNGLVAVITDVTLLKRHEKKIKKALKQAKISDKLKSSFLANMSHEIRTPMNAILGFADILKNEKDLDKEIRDEYFSIIEDKGNELLQIISDIIDISKIESKIITINDYEFEINEFLKTVLDILKKEPGYNEEQVKIQLFLPEGSENLKIITDRYRLNQILTNLINNSKKFTEKGEIEFGYKLVDEDFEFFVRDTGIGISNENQKIIFDRFRQADNKYTRGFGGTGLGLNICKNLINLMEGDIRVESKLSVGSTFYFTLPKEKRAKK